MFAIIAAVLFAIVLVLDLADKDIGPVLTAGFLVNLAFLCIALHLAGAAGRIRSYRGRRPGPG